MALLDEIDGFCRALGVSTASFDRMIDKPGFVLSLRNGSRPHPRVLAHAKRILRDTASPESSAIAPSDEWGDPIRALSLLSPGLGLAAREARRAGLSPTGMQTVMLGEALLTFTAGRVFGVGGELRT